MWPDTRIHCICILHLPNTSNKADRKYRSRPIYIYSPQDVFITWHYMYYLSMTSLVPKNRHFLAYHRYWAMWENTIRHICKFLTLVSSLIRASCNFITEFVSLCNHQFTIYITRSSCVQACLDADLKQEVPITANAPSMVMTEYAFFFLPQSDQSNSGKVFIIK